MKKTIAFLAGLIAVCVLVLWATNTIDHQLTDPVVKTCKLPPGQKENHGISELPLNGGVIYPDGFRYDCTEHGLVVSSDPLTHDKPSKYSKGLAGTNQLLPGIIDDGDPHPALTRSMKVRPDPPKDKPGDLTVTCEYPGCNGRLQTTGPAITTRSGNIASTGTIGSVTISTYPTGTVSVYSSNSPVCRIHPDEEITGVVGICDEKRAAEDAMKQYVLSDSKSNTK